MSRRYDIGEQESSASRGGSNRRKVTVKVCMLDDSMVKFDIEVSAYAVNATTVLIRAKKITEICRYLFFLLAIHQVKTCSVILCLRGVR